MKRIAVIANENLEALALLRELGAELTLFSSNDLNVANFDALVLLAGPPDFTTTINDFYREEKPIGAVGEAIHLVAKSLGARGVTVAQMSGAKKYGAIYETCAADDFVTDREHRVISTLGELSGLRKAFAELVEMA